MGHKPSLHEWRSRWDAYSVRERRMVVAALVVVAVALLWWMAIEPALQGREQARKDIPELQRQWSEMRWMAEEVRRLRTMGEGQVHAEVTESSLKASAESARLVGVITKTTPEGHLTLIAENVPAPLALRWLATAPRALRLSVASASMKRHGAGLMDLEVRFEAITR